MARMRATINCPEQRDKRGNFVTTYSGVKFFIDKCNIQDVPIEDIAHALSMNCRFNGHLERFYSVAEHSVILSYHVPLEYRMTALLHDVSEAFVPDMPRPFKAQITGFDTYEEKIMRSVADHYGTYYPLPDVVQYVDKNIVRDEAENLYRNPPCWLEFYDSVVSPVWFQDAHSPAEAKRWFLDRFYYLQAEEQDARLQR